MSRSGGGRAVAIEAACFAFALLGNECGGSDHISTQGDAEADTSNGTSGSSSGSGNGGSSGISSSGGFPALRLPDGGTCVLDDAGLYACPDASWPACDRVEALSADSLTAPCSWVGVTLGTSCMGCGSGLATGVFAVNYTCKCAVDGGLGPFVPTEASSSGAGADNGHDLPPVVGPWWVCVATNYSCCVPGSTRCEGNGVVTCNGIGTWGAAYTAPGSPLNSDACVNSACVDGACQGVCVPGSTQCSGGVLQTCNATGVWQPVIACDAGTCDAGTVACAADAGQPG